MGETNCETIQRSQKEEVDISVSLSDCLCFILPNYRPMFTHFFFLLLTMLSLTVLRCFGLGEEKVPHKVLTFSNCLDQSDQWVNFCLTISRQKQGKHLSDKQVETPRKMNYIYPLPCPTLYLEDQHLYKPNSTQLNSTPPTPITMIHLTSVSRAVVTQPLFNCT